MAVADLSGYPLVSGGPRVRSRSPTQTRQASHLFFPSPASGAYAASPRGRPVESGPARTLPGASHIHETHSWKPRAARIVTGRCGGVTARTQTV